MGGRGISSGANINQVTIEQIQDKLEVDEIIREAESIRNASVISDKTDERIPNLYKKCFCCNEFTIPLNSEYVKCIICGWIDDKFQNAHIHSREGMNEVSLDEAKRVYFSDK